MSERCKVGSVACVGLLCLVTAGCGISSTETAEGGRSVSRDRKPWSETTRHQKASGTDSVSETEPLELAVAQTELPETPPELPVETEVNLPAETAVEAVREVTFEEAEATFRDERYDEAVDLFLAYTGRRPENPWGYFMLGLSQWRSGYPADAEGSFEKALEIDPEHSKSLVNLGRLLVEQGRPQDAQEKVEVALRIDPDSNPANRILGRSHHEQGQIDRAKEAYRGAIRLDPEDAWSMNNLGLILIEEERFADALGPLARAAELRDDVPFIHNNLGIALEQRGHFSLAAESYERALALDESYARVAVSLARVEERVDDAIDAIDLSTVAQSFAEEIRHRVDTVPAPALESVEPTDVANESTRPEEDSPAFVPETELDPEGEAEASGTETSDSYDSDRSASPVCFPER